VSIIVQKFGGSSVADIGKINKIAAMIAVVKKQGNDVAVVVSAMGKTTNSLIEMAKSISKDPPKREMDMLLSTGERITMSLLCIALNELGVEAISLTGSQAGIITNDRHNDARVIEVRPFRVQDEMANGKVVVVGGFQGVSYKKDVTTLGRGGSDTSAVALAAALNAERCEIYSDVDGVYTTDPSFVKEAKHLPEISYQQMQEMSMAGAKVLNSQAVQFAKEANIAIYARSTFAPGKETIVRKLTPGTTKGIKSVVYENDIVRVSLFNIEKNFELLMNLFEDKQVKMKEFNALETADESIPCKATFILSYKNIFGWENLKNELENKFKNEIKIEFGFGAVSLIGESVNEGNNLLAETLNVLKGNEIKIFGITTTSFRISLLVNEELVKKSVQLLHKKWIGE
jgi:aspartate kinase